MEGQARHTFVGRQLLAFDDIIFIRIIWVREGLRVGDHSTLGQTQLSIPTLAVLDARASIAIVSRGGVIVNQFDVVARRSAAFFR